MRAFVGELGNTASAERAVLTALFLYGRVYGLVGLLLLGVDVEVYLVHVQSKALGLTEKDLTLLRCDYSVCEVFPDKLYFYLLLII